MAMDLDSLDDIDSMSLAAGALDTFLGDSVAISAGAPAPPRSATSNGKKYLDVHHFADGTLICCKACDGGKDRRDPPFPDDEDRTIWWKDHGRPDEPGSHSDFDGYCDMIWAKQKYTLSKEEFIEWAHTKEGKHQMAHFTKFIVEKRAISGPNARLSAKAWASCPPPAALIRETIDETSIIEPDDEFLDAQQFEDRFKFPPAQLGYKLEKETRKDGSVQTGVWVQKDEPLRRRHAKRNLLKLAEEIDNNETALTSDQIAKRYRAEVAASSQANSSVSAASIAAAVKRAAQQEQASRASLPDTSSGQANSAPLVGQGMLSEQAVAVAPAGSAGGSAAGAAAGSKRPKPQPNPGPKRGGGHPSTPTKRSATAATPATGSGSGGKTKPMTKTQMVDQKLEVEAATHKFKSLTLDAELPECEAVLVRASKNLDKKKGRLATLAILDPEILDFQIFIEDSLATLATYLDLIGKHKGYTVGYTNPGSIKPIPIEKVAEDFSAAYKDVEAIDGGNNVPKLFKQAHHKLLAVAFRSRNDIAGFLRYLEQLDQSDLNCNRADFILDLLASCLTEILKTEVRTGTGGTGDDEDKVVKSFFMLAAQKHNFPPEASEQLAMLGRLVNADLHSTADLREAIAKVSGKPITLHGLYKVFVALGRSYVQDVNNLLLTSSKDKGLEKSRERCSDLLVSLRPEAETPWQAGFLRLGKQAVEHFSRCVTGSRIFIEEHSDIFNSFGTVINHGMCKLMSAANKALQEYIDIRVKVDDPSDLTLEDVLRDVRAEPDGQVDRDSIESLVACQQDLLRPTCQAYRSKHMDSTVLATLEKTDADITKLCRVVPAWQEVFNMLKNSAADLQDFDLGQFSSLMHTFVVHGFMSKAGEWALNLAIKPQLEQRIEADLASAIQAFEKTLLQSSEAFCTPQGVGGGAPGEAAFLPGSLEEVSFLKPIAEKKRGVTEFEALEKLSYASGKLHARTVAVAQQYLEGLRISMASLALHLTTWPPCIKIVKANDKHIEEFFMQPSTIEKFKSLAKDLDEFEAFLGIKSDAEDDACVAAMVALGHKQLLEARAVLRNLAEKAQSFWSTGIDRLKSNVREGAPPDWKSYTIEQPDVEMIMEKIINNDATAKLASSMAALKLGAKNFDQAVRKLAEVLCSPGMLLPDNFKGDVNQLAADGKIMVAVRATCTVTYVKLPKAETAKSKAGLVREVKRLIAALEVVLDQKIWDQMNEAAK